VRTFVAIAMIASCHREASEPAQVRPASISDDDVALVEKLLPRLDQLAHEITAVGSDCPAATRAITRVAGELGPQLATVMALEARTHADPAAEAWARTSYGPKVVGPLLQIVKGACQLEASYSQALAALQP
jgi:hypothetical protein